MMGRNSGLLIVDSKDVQRNSFRMIRSASMVVLFALSSFGCVDIMGPATSRSNELLLYNRSGCDVVIFYNWKDDVLQETGLIEDGRGTPIQKLPIGKETLAKFRLNVYSPRQSPTIRTDTFQKTTGQNLQMNLSDGSYDAKWTIATGGNQLTVSNQSQVPRLVVVKYAPVVDGVQGISTSEIDENTPVGPLGIPSVRQLGAAPLLDADSTAKSVLITVAPREQASAAIQLSGSNVKYDFAIVVMDLVIAHDFETKLIPEEKKKVTAIIEKDFNLNLLEKAPPQ